MKQIIDYLYQFEGRLVSPIWEGEKMFPFLCLGHLACAQALGFRICQVTPVLSVVEENCIVNPEQMDAWIGKKTFDYSYFDNEIANLKRLKNGISGKLCGGGCFGPLTVVSDILGAERLLKLIVKSPGMIEKAVGYVTGYMVELAEKEVEAGADFFWIAEPLASLLSPDNFWKFSGKYLKKIYASAGVPGFLHVCGKTLRHTQHMVRTGAQVLSIDSCTDLGKCIRMVDEKVVIMGNIATSLLRYGAPEEVRLEMERMLTECRNLKNYVISTGCSIMDGTPAENMQIIFEEARRFPAWTNEEYRMIRNIIKRLQNEEKGFEGRDILNNGVLEVIWKAAIAEDARHF